MEIDQFGTKRYYKNGKLHRLNGPALEFADGYKEWWINGKRIDCKDQEEFLRLIKMKASGKMKCIYYSIILKLNFQSL